jgi:hypothetical protein
MNAKTIAKNYAFLTPEERFRLILAAGARSDETEQERLRQAGQRITLSMSDHAPWAHAFDELALLVFLEILEEAAKHHDAFERWCDAGEVWNNEGGTDADQVDEDEDAAAAEDPDSMPAEPDCRSITSANSDDDGVQARTLNHYLAQGFILRTKLWGWKVLCRRLSVPAFAVWQLLPGFDRLQHAMQLLEDNEFRLAPVFQPEGRLRWLSRIRPEGAAEPSMENLISPERFADDLEKVFRRRVEWWGG